MVGQIPGLQRIDLNVPDPISAARAKGYNMGLVAILDKPETITVYAQHPAHMMYVQRHAVTARLWREWLMNSSVHKFREELCNDTLAYDLEFAT